MASRRKNWILTQAALRKLLALFDSDLERAGQNYELMRSKLIRFFQCRGCGLPHEMADEVMNRIARRVDEGEVVRIETLSEYFYGVARNVLREFHRGPENRSSSLEMLSPSEHPLENPTLIEKQKAEGYLSERRLQCLESCLAGLPVETRGLILSYYEKEEGIKIENRQRLAAALAVPMNALRIRVHRVRVKLEKCLTGCLERSASREMDSGFLQ